MKKKITLSTALSFIFVVITVTFCLTMIISAKLFEKKVANVNEKEAMYEKLAEIDQIVRRNFYTSIDDKVLLDGLSAGYVGALQDSEAKYYTAAEISALQNISKGKIIGIGIEVSKDISGYYKVVSVDSNSPADIAEIQKENMITHINDVSVMTLPSADVRAKLKGNEGESVKITYLKDNEEKVAQLVFAIYERPSIRYSLEDGVGYIKISSFVEKTASEVEYAIRNLLSQGANSFAIDLRFNSSKEFKYAAEVADIFAKEGTSIYAQYADDSKKVLFTSGKDYVSQPIGIIMNNATGYAAEMFAVIVKDLGNAKLIGTQTMGQGTLQTVYRLADGSGIEITTARLIPANSEEYHGVGLLPDYEKALDSDQELNFYDLTVSTDPQIQRAFEVVKNMVLQQ